jgi:co-chaperonin GroES (HSP10)
VLLEKVDKDTETTTESGIILKHNVMPNSRKAKVLAVGLNKQNNEWDTSVHVGDVVLYDINRVIEATLESDDHMLVNEEDIIAIFGD